MKPILLACCLVLLSSVTVFAQKNDTKPGGQKQPTSKDRFENTILRFDVFASRLNKELTNEAFDDLLLQMDGQITEVKKGTNPTFDQKKLNAEQQLYNDIKALSADKISHKETIKTKAQQFSSYF